MARARREVVQPRLLSFQFLTQDFESEPLVLGGGQRVAQFAVSLRRLKKSGRPAASELGVGELALERVKFRAKVLDSPWQRLQRPCLVESQLALGRGPV